MTTTNYNIKNRQLCLSALLFVVVLMLSLPVTAQLSSGSIYGSFVIGENSTYINGDINLKPTGELYLGSHAPRGIQTNTLILYGNFIGESGSKLYTSVTDNSNLSGTRGFIDINGIATKIGNEGTRIEVDMHPNWNGACIDLVRAHKSGTNIATFVMDEMDYNGHLAQLKTRQSGTDLIWFIAEKIIVDQLTFAQNLCKNDPKGFEPLVVLTTSDNVKYQWYRCNADGTGAVNLGSANGAQTATYTPPINLQAGTYYYFCVVTSLNCENNKDTTYISEPITLFQPIEITRQPEDQFICKGDGDFVTLFVEANGDIISYQWYKNGEAVNNSNTPYINVAIEKGKLDQYYVEINGQCGIVRSDTASVSPTLDIIVQKMNNLLIVNDNANTNGGYNFTYYTWYRNGVKVGEGAHDNFGGHYYTGDYNDLDPYSEYWVEVITTDGKIFRSCVYIPVIKRFNMEVTAYPNPSSENNSHIITVESKGIERSSLDNGSITVYKTNGALVDVIPVNGRESIQVPLQYAQGVYILQFKTDVFQKTIKIVVVK